MKHLFIINPIAGKSTADEKRRAIDEAIRKLDITEREGVDFEIYTTKSPLDACKKIIRESKRNDFIRVYASGGDGTLNECVNAAVGRSNVAITMIPSGTGNDFVKAFGKEEYLFSNILKLIRGETRKIDVINCDGRYSVNVSTVGFDARVGANVHKYSKYRFLNGGMAYLASVAENFTKNINTKMLIETEGMTCGPDIMLVCVCNGTHYGGGFNPVKTARIDDGYLDVLVISEVNRLILASAIMAYKNGEYEKYPQYVTYIRTKELSIKAQQPEYINLDGEIECRRNINMKIEEKALNFIFPRDMDYFSVD